MIYFLNLSVGLSMMILTLLLITNKAKLNTEIGEDKWLVASISFALFAFIVAELLSS